MPSVVQGKHNRLQNSWQLSVLLLLPALLLLLLQLQLCLSPTWMDEKVFGTARRVS
jgi:hypothetical protein